MSDFSKQLQKYVQRSGNTNVQIARLCGVERSLLQKYISGQRVPAQAQTVVKMTEVLQLSPGERKKFLRAYYTKSVGPEIYEQRQLIQHMIQNFTSYSKKQQEFYPRNCMGSLNLNEVPEVTILDNTIENWERVTRLFEMEIQDGEGEMLVIAQPDVKALNALITRFLSYEHTKVMQIVCAENWIARHRSNINIKILSDLLPFLFGSDRYESRVYYEHLESHRNTMNVLPNLIVTKNFVACFDHDYKSGILYKNEIINEYYRNIFYKRLKECRAYYHTRQDAIQSISAYHKEIRCTVSVQAGPGLLPFLTKKDMIDLANDNLKNKKEAIDAIFELYEGWRQQAREEGGCFQKCICTIKGMKRFIEEGIVPELCYYIKPVPLEMRIILLQRMLVHIEQKDYNLMLIDEQKYPLDQNLIIDICGNSVAYIISAENEERKMVKVEEISVMEALNDYILYLAESEWLLSKEKVEEYLKDEIQKLRTRI